MSPNDPAPGADTRADGKPHRVMFRVYRRYFDALEAGTKNIEFREAKRPWLSYLDSQPSVAIFTCGRRRHERPILGVALWNGKVEFHLAPAIKPEDGLAAEKAALRRGDR